METMAKRQEGKKTKGQGGKEGVLPGGYGVQAVDICVSCMHVNRNPMDYWCMWHRVKVSPTGHCPSYVCPERERRRRAAKQPIHGLTE